MVGMYSLLSFPYLLTFCVAATISSPALETLVSGQVFRRKLAMIVVGDSLGVGYSAPFLPLAGDVDAEYLTPSDTKASKINCEPTAEKSERD